MNGLKFISDLVISRFGSSLGYITPYAGCPIVVAVSHYLCFNNLPVKHAEADGAVESDRES